MTQKTKSAMGTEISSLYADNTTGNISAADVRTVSQDTIDSLVGGPTSAVANQVATYADTTGQLLLATPVTVDGSGNTAGVGTLASGNHTITGTLTVTSTSSLQGDITVATGKAIQPDTTTAHTVLFKAYDVDGTAYKTFATLTNGNTPDLNIAAPSGGTIEIDGAVIGGVAPAAATVTTLIATGNVTGQAYIVHSVGNTLTATGTTRTDALQLAKGYNNVTTATSGTGVILPTGVAGMRITIFNNGASAIKVYGSGSDTIDGVAAATGVTLTNALRCEYFCVAAATWISAKLGATST